MAASYDWDLTAAGVIADYAAHLQGADATIFARSLDDACADVNRAFLSGGMDPSGLLTDDHVSGARIVAELAVVYYNQRVTGNVSKAVDTMYRSAQSQVSLIRKDANTWVAYRRQTGLGTVTTFLDTDTMVNTAYIDGLPHPGDMRWGIW